jgi:hypothetical protein
MVLLVRDSIALVHADPPLAKGHSPDGHLNDAEMNKVEIGQP